MSSYPTNLTDKQWQVIKNIVETKERKRKHSLREMINAMMYITKTGCQWRMLPKEFGPWQQSTSISVNGSWKESLSN